jgi:hypothetical protein
MAFLVSVEFTDPEVNQVQTLRLVIPANQHVLRLDVAVHD